MFASFPQLSFSVLHAPPAAVKAHFPETQVLLSPLFVKHWLLDEQGAPGPTLVATQTFPSQSYPAEHWLESEQTAPAASCAVHTSELLQKVPYPHTGAAVSVYWQLPPV